MSHWQKVSLDALVNAEYSPMSGQHDRDLLDLDAVTHTSDDSPSAPRKRQKSGRHIVRPVRQPAVRTPPSVPRPASVPVAVNFDEVPRHIIQEVCEAAERRLSATSSPELAAQVFYEELRKRQ